MPHVFSSLVSLDVTNPVLHDLEQINYFKYSNIIAVQCQTMVVFTIHINIMSVLEICCQLSLKSDEDEGESVEILSLINHSFSIA
jgi:hypothetical protein